MKWLQEFRKEKGFSRTEMAKMLGISTSFYDKVEYGQRKPSANFILHFIDVFPDVDANLFFTNKSHNMCIKKAKKSSSPI